MRIISNYSKTMRRVVRQTMSEAARLMMLAVAVAVALCSVFMAGCYRLVILPWVFLYTIYRYKYVP